MQRTAAVADALARGSSALVELQSASTLEEARHAWLDFLFDIERVWNKLQAHYSKSPKWGGWCSPYVKARKQDQLLQYLQQARNAEEHTLDETTALVPGRVTGIQSAMPNKPVHIESLQIHRGSMRLEAAPGTLEILVSPPQMVLQPAKNRGVAYAVPTSHLGRRTDARNVIAVAQMAFEYYQVAADKAEAFFCK